MVREKITTDLKFFRGSFALPSDAQHSSFFNVFTTSEWLWRHFLCVEQRRRPEKFILCGGGTENFQFFKKTRLYGRVDFEFCRFWTESTSNEKLSNLPEAHTERILSEVERIHQKNKTLSTALLKKAKHTKSGCCYCQCVALHVVKGVTLEITAAEFVRSCRHSSTDMNSFTSTHYLASGGLDAAARVRELGDNATTNRRGLPVTLQLLSVSRRRIFAAKRDVDKTCRGK